MILLSAGVFGTAKRNLEKQSLTYQQVIHNTQVVIRVNLPTVLRSNIAQRRNREII